MMGGIRSGKTLRALYRSARDQVPILVSSRERAENLLAMAKELELQIPAPMLLPKPGRGDGKSSQTMTVIYDIMRMVEDAE